MKSKYKFYEPRFPQPNFPNKIIIPFLLLLTPPYSGSTLMGSYLNQKKSIVGLREDFEGQWLIKGMSDKNRWSADESIDFNSVAKVWNKKIDNIKNKQKIDYIFEKSPPNMVRFKKLQEILSEYKCVINIRHPKSAIASKLKRYYKLRKFKNIQNEEIIRIATNEWLDQANFLIKLNTLYDFDIIQYEKFCQNPNHLVKLYELNEADFDENIELKIKNYPIQKITDMNNAGSSKLNQVETDIIEQTIPEEILKYFQY